MLPIDIGQLLLLVIIGFVAVYMFFVRRNRYDNRAERPEPTPAAEQSLQLAVNRAAHAVHEALLQAKTPESAIRAGLTAYAERLGVVWNSMSVTVVDNAIKCKIGGDVVAVRILREKFIHEIEVEASRGKLVARSALDIVADEADLFPHARK